MIHFGKSLVLLLLIFSVTSELYCEDVEKKVEQILASAESHNSSKSVKALAKLGSPAVPILVRRLKDYRDPSIILSALRRIKDPESIPGILDYLSGFQLQERKNLDVVNDIMTTINEIGDPGAQPELLRILRNSQFTVEARLYAASALAKIGSDSTRKEASEFILNSPEVQKNISKIAPVDLDAAYFRIGSPQAIEKLFHAIQTGLPYEQLFIIDLFSTDPTPQIVAGLLVVAENPKHFPDVRFRAVEILMKQKDVDQQRLLKILHSLRAAAPEKGLNKSLVTKERLDAMIQNLSKKM